MRLPVAIALLMLLAAQGSASAQQGSSGRTAQPIAPLIAFERTADRVTQIYVMNVDGTGQRSLAPGRSAAWSPDGSMIAFVRGSGQGIGDLLVINRDGTELRRIVSTLVWVGYAPTWSPDGRQIAFSGQYKRYGAAIYTVNADGSGLARLTAPRPKIEDLAPAWSPDGTQIVFERDNYGDVRGFPLIVMNPDGTGQRVVTPKTTLDALVPAWSPDGLRITFAAGQGVVNGDIFVMNRDGSAQENLTRTKSPDDDVPLFSPDGRTIVFSSFTGGPGKREIHLINVAGTRHLNLTRNRAADLEPAWTSDGRILFVSSRDGNGDIYVMTAAGAGVTNLTNTPTELGFNRRPKWSPTP